MLGRIREWLYRGRLLRATELPAFVVSVGNISMGGTGKTPLVLALGEWALNEGIRTAVLTRGYGRQSRKLWALAPNDPLPSSREIGDEPWLIKCRLPQLGLLVHGDRARMALRHWSQIGSPQLVILDDGFQHWQTVRDLDLVLVDGNRDVHGRAIPFGRLREPWSALARADLVLWQGEKNQSKEVPAPLNSSLLPVWRRRNISRFPAAIAKTEWVGLYDPSSGLAIDALDREIVVAVGIEKPQRFLLTLEKQGLRPNEVFFFRDHQMLNKDSLEKLKKSVQQRKKGILLLTEKDWARWSTLFDELPLGVVRVRSTFGAGLDPVFAEIKKCFLSG
jgi:tetraacyldisaccharide 4'-kinase